MYFGQTEFLIDQIYKSESFPLENLIGHNGILLSHKIDEYIGGLYVVYKNTHKREKIVANALSGTIDKFIRYFFKDDDLLIAYDVSQNRPIKVRTFWSSGLLETFLEMQEDFPDLVPMTLRIIDNWINDPFFVRHGLFPFRVNPGRYFFNRINNHVCVRKRWNEMLNKNVPIPAEDRRRDLTYLFKRYVFEGFPTGNFVQLMKANSTMVFSLIQAYRLTCKGEYRESIEHWVENSYQKLHDDGKIYGYLDLSFKQYDATLADAFIYIDILCDSYFFINGNFEYLNRAQGVAQRWIDLQWDNGLIYRCVKEPKLIISIIS